MGRETNKTGILGEDMALEFLRHKGYKLVCRNFRTPFGELDIVARHRGFIVFIEVKTRTGSSLGPPFLSVTRNKQVHIIKNALCYLKKCGRIDSNWRIDVISVKLDRAGGLESIEHIENAVEDIYRGGY